MPLVVCVPVSLGELVDKITILRIKRQRLMGSAVDYVEKELNALEGILVGLECAITPAAVEPLAQVNQQLWHVEDAIREQEHRQLFDDRFIQLARAVYQLNDCRAALKRAINLRCGSAYVEEKSYLARVGDPHGGVEDNVAI